jgi:hypothetical protein
MFQKLDEGLAILLEGKFIPIAAAGFDGCIAKPLDSTTFLNEFQQILIFGQMRSDIRSRHVPIVAYSIHLSVINRAFEEGFHSFLGKPLDATQFGEQVKRIPQGEHIWETI